MGADLKNLILQLRKPTFVLRDHGLPDLRIQKGHDSMAAEVNRLVAAQAERWILHHPDDEPLEDLDLPPRAIWSDELVEVRENGGVRREIFFHRRMSPED